MSESKEADTNGFSEVFHIMSWWMVKTLGPKLCKTLILFIGDDAPYLPCIVKLTKLWNCLNQNLLKRNNKSFNYGVSTMEFQLCEIIIWNLEEDDHLYMKLIKKIKLQSFAFSIKNKLTENIVNFSNALIALCYHQKHNICKG